jgi:hypothetical protein
MGDTSISIPTSAIVTCFALKLTVFSNAASTALVKQRQSGKRWREDDERRIAKLEIKVKERK